MSKPSQLELHISDKLLQATKDSIKRRIIQKLGAARKLVDFDKEVSAGIYVYAVEEIGNLDVLKNVQNGKLLYRPDEGNFDNANPKLIEISYTDIQLSTVKTNGGFI
jgi:hypothetical protein